MKTIRALTLDDIKAYTTVAYNAYPSFKDFSNEGLENYYEDIKDSMENDDKVHFYGMFEDMELISVMRLFDFKMNCFDKVIDSSGLGYLGVDLLHKKEKIALDMVKFYENLYLEKNMPLATLLPFRPDFYKSMGYGMGTKISQYKIPTKNIPDFSIKSNLRFIENNNLDELLAFHEEILGKKHGMIGKIYDEINDLKYDNNNKILGNYNSKNELIAYMVFNFQNANENNLFVNNIYVKEMEYKDSNSLKVFLSFLSKQTDQIRFVIFNTKDENFHQIFNNPLNDTDNYVPYGNIESNTQSVGIMYKILDIYKAFEMINHRDFHSLDLRLNLAILDDYSEEITEYALEFKDGKYVGKSKDFDVTIKLKLSDFSSLFMGAISVKSLYSLGLLSISDLAYLDILDFGFYSPVKPICNTDF